MLTPEPRGLTKAFGADALPVAAVFVLAFAVRLIPVLAGGGLLGAPNYDPSVYYAAAVGFFEGRLPYRDFLLLHPPGIVLLLQPFAALGAWLGDPLALASTRVAFMVLGALTAALICVLLVPGGRAAALAGGGLYAVYPAAAHVERAPWLEAPASLLLVLALIALRPPDDSVRPWRTAAAGALLSLAMLTKLWGVVLLVIILCWVLLTRGIRPALSYLLGAVGAGVAVLLPFVAGWTQLWTDAVTAQVGRPSVRASPLLRIGTLLGLDQADATRLPAPLTVALAGCVLALALVAVRSRAGRLYLLLLATTVATLLLVAAWYPNYPAFAAAPLGLTVGSAVSVICSQQRLVARVGAALVAVLIALGAIHLIATPSGYSFPREELTAVLSTRDGCVTTDHPIALILTDRLRHDLRSGCQLVVDLSGYIHVVPGSDRRSENPEFQAVMMNYLGSGRTTVVMSGLWPGGFSRASRELVESWPVVGTAGDIKLREPGG
ncbi:MAG: hypothetical protein QM695_13170 [Micropruina sp.]